MFMLTPHISVSVRGFILLNGSNKKQQGTLIGSTFRSATKDKKSNMVHFTFGII